MGRALKHGKEWSMEKGDRLNSVIGPTDGGSSEQGLFA